jgi:cystathionine beta-lyase/cystathionine gamma-synthase
MDLSYIINHLGEERDEYYGAVNPPIHQTSNFRAKNVKELRHKIQHEFETPFYTRGHNPTVAILRKKIAALEGTEDCLLFSSGSAAIAAAVMNVVKNGDHVVCVEKPYGWTNFLLNNLLVHYGVTTTMIDGRDPENFRKAIQPNTKLFFMESPNTMTFELQDIEAVVKIAQEKNIVTILDNSYSTPLFQQPAAFGVDLICHSATKYFSGHSDVVGGIVCGSSERIKSIFKSEFMCLGASPSPHDAAALIKGIRTLPLRVEQTARNAAKVAFFLEYHNKVKKLHWPFANSFSQKELAKKQMTNCGSLMSIELDVNSFEEVERFCDSLQYFLLATSWGGYESLVYPICAFSNSKENHTHHLPWNLVRLYVGLEDPELLMADLDNALNKI